MEVSCGVCIGCRLDRSRMWAMRCVHESSLHEMDGGNCFVTLTYADEHMPEDFSLRHEDFQLFLKRLRKHFYPQKIKFYMCGEYGNKCQHIPTYSKLTVDACEQCNVGRPHYHALLFNCHFDDEVAVGFDTRRQEPVWSSPTLEALWKLGHVQTGVVNFQSAAYVSRYVLKKQFGLNQRDHYSWVDDYGQLHFIKPEYNSMSKGNRKGQKGIGHEWYQKYKGDLWPSDETPLPGEDCRVIPKVPRYYEQILEAEDPLALEQVKEARRLFAEKHKEDYTPERLMQRYNVKKRQVEMLKRGL